MLHRSTKQDTRTAILDQSRALFAARGYEAVSMRDIAEAVGIRASSIYNHVSGKQSLLEDLMQAHMARVTEEMEAALSEVHDPVQRLVVFARNHLLIHLDYRDDVFLAYYELRSLDAEARARVTEMRDRYEGLLREILAAGDFATEDPAVHARALLAMLTGVTVWYDAGGRLSRDAVIDTYLRAAVQSVGLDHSVVKGDRNP